MLDIDVEFKFENEDDNRLLQEMLLKEGYFWRGAGKKVAHLGAKTIRIFQGRDYMTYGGHSTTHNKGKIIKATNISRAFYKNRIIKEIDGRLLVKCSK